MAHFSRHKLWVSLLLLVVIVIGIYSCRSINLPDNVDYIDKWLHALAFFGLSALAQLAGIRPRVWFFALAAYGGLIELVQSTLPHRFASISDWIADLVGIGLYLGLLQIPHFQNLNRWLTGES